MKLPILATQFPKPWSVVPTWEGVRVFGGLTLLVAINQVTIGLIRVFSTMRGQLRSWGTLPLHA